MTGEQALVATIAAITAWEIACIRRGRHDDLLSRVMDRLRAKHIAIDIAAHAVILTTALHLVRRIPSGLDPYALVSR
ncbi:DUF7427 family protein [Gordonia sp. (in: high G+C Gram-positive bacteria)]|uniref:DUF7427 family protein n=1 Tax=Gordonia sp. (in: high G+C Gram-positive bacteria) TaxID=84139 RepID=UPI003C73829F